MKKQITWFGVVAAIIIGISTFFIGCMKDDLNDVVAYKGQVVYINTTIPFADLTVKVTNGKDTHCQTQTDAGGFFSLKVRVSEIDGDYYLLAGDSTCIPKKVGLGGYGQAEVDLGVIEVEGPALPTVKTSPIREENISADEAIISGEVLTDGRMRVTARGICYGKDPYPTVEGLHTTEGSGLGAFTSTLKNLEFNTIYYARAYATNQKGTAYGDQVKFTTEEGVAIVITDTIINITAHSMKCVGHVESDGGFPVTKRGTCWSKRPDPTIYDDCTDDGAGKGEFVSVIKDLTENATYYIRTYATNSTKTTYGEQKIITTLDGLAVVQTDSIPISSITATGFTAYGTVISDCDVPVTARGFCYSTSQYPTIENDHTTVGKGLGKFQSNITNLQVGTTYYVRAYATNETATTYGEQFPVTTKDGLPIVTTSETTATSVNITSGGTITSDGGYNITARGVCYSTNNSMPTIEDSFTTSGIGIGTFSTIIIDVNVNTTYYVRAYATNNIGTGYGDVAIVQTGTGLPTIEIIPIGENITETTITTGGHIIDDGGYSIISRGVCWSTMPYPTINDSHTTDGIGDGYYASTITNVDNTSQTYYIRAYAVNENGVSYSEQLKITPELWQYINFPSMFYAGYIYKLGEFIGVMDYDAAVTTCATYEYAGYNDWFIPTREELIEFMKIVRTGWGFRVVNEEDNECRNPTHWYTGSGDGCDGIPYSYVNKESNKTVYTNYASPSILTSSGTDNCHICCYWCTHKGNSCNSGGYYYYHRPIATQAWNGEANVRLVRRTRM